MDPIQADKNTPPSMVARSREVAGNVLVGVGVLLLTLTVEPTQVFGENPAGDFFAMSRPSSSLAAGRRDAPAPPVLKDSVSLRTEPHTTGTLTMRSARNLFTGHALALERVRDVPACGALFETFTTTGVENIAHTFYVAPSAGERREFCVGGVTAFTQVGSRVTRLCPSFGDVDRRTAALLLIHEALHSAGMPESPSTSGALTPSEINRLVRRACDL